MPTPLEAEISSLFSELGEARLVAEDLMQRWRLNLFNEEEQADCAQFLVAGGFFPQLFTQLSSMIDNNVQLPWAQVVEGLGRAGIRPRPIEFEALFVGAEDQNALPDLLRSHQLDLFEREFGLRRAQYRADQAATIENRKQSLKEKLQYMRVQRLFEQEEQVLEEIQAMFPEETNLSEERDSFQLRWAREILANSSTVTDPIPDLQWRADRLSPEQVSAKGMIFDRAIEMAKNDPRLAYDLAISLQMMDFYSEAIEVLRFARGSQAADWLRLELMVQSRQFVNALEEASRLELEYAGDPESVFAATYARARSLHGLGQTSMAADLLRSLVRIRPNYKSAQSLLMDWTEGEL